MWPGEIRNNIPEKRPALNAHSSEEETGMFGEEPNCGFHCAPTLNFRLRNARPVSLDRREGERFQLL
jgi:hypothetical protein